MNFASLRHIVASAAAFAVVGVYGAAQAAPDLGKRACAQEARRLCAREMRSFSRPRVEACMIAKIDQTSPTCHAVMLRIKAERESARRR